MIAPVLFVFTAILGGAMRPGYSHMAETVSELFSPGSPNKLLLDTLHTTFAILLVLFGIGILQFVQRSEQSSLPGTAGAILYIVMGLVSVTTATIFPQDAWGSPPTFPGEMHKIMSGVVGLISLLSMMLIGAWLKRTKIFPGFGTYTFVTIGVVIFSTGFYVVMMGSPFMGLAERITILIGFMWTFILSYWMYSKRGMQMEDYKKSETEK
jgi:hypothetical protein